MNQSNAEIWRQLLHNLSVSEEQLLHTTQQACRSNARKWRTKATDDDCLTVNSMVFVNLIKMYRKDSERGYFLDRCKFLGLVRKTAGRLFNETQAQANQKRVQFVEPEALEAARGRAAWDGLSGLISNCDEACEQCLSGADQDVRQVFLLKCQGVQAAHEVPTGREIARQLGVRESQVSEWWGIAKEFFRNTCGHLAFAHWEREA